MNNWELISVFLAHVHDLTKFSALYSRHLKMKKRRICWVQKHIHGKSLNINHHFFSHPHSFVCDFRLGVFLGVCILAPSDPMFIDRMGLKFPSSLRLPCVDSHNSWPGETRGMVLRISLQCRSLGSDPWVGKIWWRREWQSVPVFLPGEFHGQRSPVGYSPWGHKKSDMAERLTHWTITPAGYYCIFTLPFLFLGLSSYRWLPQFRSILRVQD